MFPNELQLMCMYTLKDLEEARSPELPRLCAKS